MPVSLAKPNLPARAPLTLKGFKAPKVYFWSRFNKFCRSAQAPAVMFKTLDSSKAQPDACSVSLAGKVVATIEHKPGGWYRIQAMTGETATLEFADVDSWLIAMVVEGLPAGHALLRTSAAQGVLAYV